jgi:hypothetical protein
MEDIEAMVSLTLPDFSKVRNGISKAKRRGLKEKQMSQITLDLEEPSVACCKSPAMIVVIKANVFQDAYG